jgi:hypothetical protein
MQPCTQVHISALLGLRGYANAPGDTNEVFLDWPDFDLAALPPAPTALAAVSFRVDPLEGAGARQSASIWAVAADGAELGQCECRCAGDYTGGAAPGASRGSR